MRLKHGQIRIRLIICLRFLAVNIFFFCEVKDEDLISRDAITNSSRQRRLEFIIESVHFVKADQHVGFYELFILC
jgi:hypothetical protein